LSERCYRCHPHQPSGSYVMLCVPHALGVDLARDQARAILKKMDRSRRQQIERERREFGYRDLGGES